MLFEKSNFNRTFLREGLPLMSTFGTNKTDSSVLKSELAERVEEKSSNEKIQIVIFF